MPQSLQINAAVSGNGQNEIPILSNLQLDHSQPGQLVVRWTTDRPATSELDYGFTSDLEQGFVGQRVGTTEHQVVLKNLQSLQTIYYRPLSRRVDGHVVKYWLQGYIPTRMVLTPSWVSVSANSGSLQNSNGLYLGFVFVAVILFVYLLYRRLRNTALISRVR